MAAQSAVINDGLAPELAVELLMKILSADTVTAHCYYRVERVGLGVKSVSAESQLFLNWNSWHVYFQSGTKMIFACELCPWPDGDDADPIPLGPQLWFYDEPELEDDTEDIELELRESLENALHDWATERFGAAPDFEIEMK